MTKSFSTPNDWKIWASSFPVRAAADAPYVSPFKVLQAADNHVDILLYGPIGRDFLSEDGMAAADFAQILGNIPKDKTPRLRINSPGGNVWDGFAIYNLARERGVKTRVDGVAASIAAVILCAGESESPEAASVMIHKCWGVFIGNADEVDGFKTQLDKHDDMQAAVFAAKTGKSDKAIKAEMSGDRWFTAKEARNFGLIDKISAAASPASPSAALASTIPAAPQGAEKPNTQNPPAKPGKQDTTMNKKMIVALLIASGIKAANGQDFNEETPVADLEAAIQQLISAKQQKDSSAANLEDIKALRAELQAIRADRERDLENNVTRELDQLVLDNKISAEEAKDFKPLCIKPGGDAILATLKKRQPVEPGAAPLAIGGSGGIAIIDQFRALQAGEARRAFLRENFAGLRQQMQRVNRGPQAANTVDSALVTAFLADGLVVVAQNRLAMVNLFTRDFPVDPVKPKATVQIRKALSGATSAQDPTNFEAGGDSNLDNIAVTMHQEGHPWHVSNADMLNGVRLEHLSEINAETFVNTLSDRITAVMTTGNFGTALTVGAAANFDAEDLSPILAVAKNYRQKNLILDGAYLAYITPKTTQQLDWKSTGAYGFDKIAEQNRWTDAAPGAVGLVCGPDAIALASGIGTEIPASEYDSIVLTPLKNGMTVRTTLHFVRSSRTWQVYHDIMLGVAAGDTTQAEVLVSA